MPLIEVHLIENVFNPEQKRQIIQKLTDAMVSDRTREHARRDPGSNLQIRSGEWGIGGQLLTTEAVKDLAADERRREAGSRSGVARR